jgi:hypothetical protein
MQIHLPNKEFQNLTKMAYQLPGYLVLFVLEKAATPHNIAD